MPNNTLIVRYLGMQEYLRVLQAMQQYTEHRDEDSSDEIWFLQHPPVYTLGRAGREEHIIDPQDIPVFHTDRGGQVTYHGPGQLVVYLLLDLGRLKLGIRQLVEHIEQAVITMLAQHDIPATGRTGAPGVYVAGRKIAALGLRVRRGCCYHGLSLNCNMDLTPFYTINPCGYPGLEVTQLKDLGGPADILQAAAFLLPVLTDRFEYGKIDSINGHLPENTI